MSSVRRAVPFATLVAVIVASSMLPLTAAAGPTPDAARSITAIERPHGLAGIGTVSRAFRGTAVGATDPQPVVPSGASPMGAESVLGPDGRVQVTETTTYPERAIGQIELVQNGDNFICTGWLIDANTILSSGHCAYDPTSSGGDIIESATFAPGRNGGTDPFGTCNIVTVFAPQQWRVNGKAAHDWSLMQLDCTIGETVGWLGFFFKPGVKALEGVAARVEGYPGDKPFGTHWMMNGKIKVATKLMLYYKMDTAGGQSGSPVFRVEGPACGGPCAMSIHSYGAGGSGPAAKHNSGPRITENRFDLFVELAALNG